MADEEKTEEKKEEKKEKYVVSEVATQTSPVILNTENKEQMDVTTAIAKLLNDVEYIKKKL